MIPRTWRFRSEISGCLNNEAINAVDWFTFSRATVTSLCRHTVTSGTIEISSIFCCRLSNRVNCQNEPRYRVIVNNHSSLTTIEAVFATREWKEKGSGLQRFDICRYVIVMKDKRGEERETKRNAYKGGKSRWNGADRLVRSVSWLLFLGGRWFSIVLQNWYTYFYWNTSWHSIGKRVPCALGYVPRSDLSAGINKRAAVRANSWMTDCYTVSREIVTICQDTRQTNEYSLFCHTRSVTARCHGFGTHYASLQLSRFSFYHL